MIATQHRYKLREGSKKETCPRCGEKRFKPYIDVTTNNVISTDCGRCDRESSCGYHKPPRELGNFSDYHKPTRRRNKTTESKEIDYRIKEIKVIDFSDITNLRTAQDLQSEMFFGFLRKTFSLLEANVAIDLYQLGSYNNSYGNRYCAFPYIDTEHNLRNIKVIQYGENGKRMKHEFASYFLIKGADLCLFGEHLLSQYPEKPVCIVESEKTAVIGSIIYPENLWLATGGSNMLRRSDIKITCYNRDLTIYPDVGKYTDWYSKLLDWKANIRAVIDITELGYETNSGDDISDIWLSNLSDFYTPFAENSITAASETVITISTETNSAASFPLLEVATPSETVAIQSEVTEIAQGAGNVATATADRFVDVLYEFCEYGKYGLQLNKQYTETEIVTAIIGNTSISKYYAYGRFRHLIFDKIITEVGFIDKNTGEFITQ